MDLLPDLEANNPNVLAAIPQRQVAHEEQQQNLAGIAPSTPGAAPHVVVPWTEEIWRQVFAQLHNARRQTQRTAFPLSENFVSIDL